MRIFLCHASEDKEAVRDLYRCLQADGFKPWLDEEDLLPGQIWQQEIPDAIHASDAVLVCLSKNATTKDGYIRDEVAYALDIAEKQPRGTIFFIPVKLEECEVPQRLRRWQWVNLFERSGYKRLTKALQKRTEIVEKEELQQAKNWLRDPMWQMVGAIVAILTLGWAIYTFYVGGGDSNSNSTLPTVMPTPSLWAVSPRLTDTPVFTATNRFPTAPQEPTSANTPLLQSPKPTNTPIPTPSTTPQSGILTNTSSQPGTLQVFVLTRSGDDPQGRVVINVGDATEASTGTTKELPAGMYDIEIEYQIEPDPELRELREISNSLVPCIEIDLPTGGRIKTGDCPNRVYMTTHRSIETVEVKGNELTTKTIYLPFDEGELKVLLRTDSGRVPQQTSSIEITAPGWETSMTRKSAENNEYDPLILTDDLTYHVTALYGTGLKPIESVQSNIAVQANQTTETTIMLPPVEEGQLTVLLRTESGRILDYEATVKVTASETDEQSMEIEEIEGTTQEEFSTPLLTGTYNIIVTYLDAETRLDNIQLGVAGTTETFVFSDTGTLAVVLRNESGMVLSKEAMVAIYPIRGDEAIFSTQTTDEYSVKLLPGSYRIQAKYKIAKDVEEQTEEVVIEANEYRETLITFPNLGTLVVSPRTRSGNVINRSDSTIKIHDSIGREIDSRKIEPQSDYDELLKTGTYEITYEYDMPSAMTPVSQMGEVRANATEEITIDLPFDEGQIEVSVVSNDKAELPRKAIISIFDDVGRSIVAVQENNYSAWLPVGQYRVEVEYGGERVFAKTIEINLDEPINVLIEV